MSVLYRLAALALLGAATPASADPVSYTGSLPPETAGFTQGRLNVAGYARDLLIYRPPGRERAPLLVLFTGTGGTLEYSLLDELGRGSLQEFAEREGVVVAAPLPRTMDRGDWDNHSAGTPYWETALAEGNDAAPSADPDLNPDLLFTRAILAEARRAYGTDPARVYLLGFSNGAFFSYLAAAALPDQVAAFAETGGGLVLDHTTAGEPEPCAPVPVPAVAGEVRSCDAAGWRPGSCATGGATPRPLAPALAARVPPGLLEANDDDSSVPFAHTCNLAQALAGRSEVVTRIVHAGGGHIVNGDFLENAWSFFRDRRLGDDDRIFNAAELLYPGLFAPGGARAQSGYGYYYRYYGATGSYLGSQGQTIYYLLDGQGGPAAAGSFGELLPRAVEAGF